MLPAEAFETINESSRRMSPNPDAPQSKKRESRAGTRRVTSLSAEQLERKRANDREAQRTIRQRTKEHIERLELQVAELKTKGDRFDEVVRRNAALEDEIRTLRQQLVLASGGGGFQTIDETYSAHPGVMVPSPQYPGAVGSSRTPAARSTSSQVSVARDWPSYSSTRPSSRCESSDTDYSTRVEPWLFEGPPHTSAPMPVTQSHVGFPGPGGHIPDSSFHQAYPQIYHAGVPHRSNGEQIQHNPQQPMAYEPSQRTLTVPSEQRPAGYTPLHPSQQYQSLREQHSRDDFCYNWGSRS